jgi:hypothetical protein
MTLSLQVDSFSDYFSYNLVPAFVEPCHFVSLIDL